MLQCSRCETDQHLEYITSNIMQEGPEEWDEYYEIHGVKCQQCGETGLLDMLISESEGVKRMRKQQGIAEWVEDEG